MTSVSIRTALQLPFTLSRAARTSSLSLALFWQLSNGFAGDKLVESALKFQSRRRSRILQATAGSFEEDRFRSRNCTECSFEEL
jgi:hypothetical protein